MEKPQLDSLTVAKKSLKMLMEVAVNNSFGLAYVDKRVAFLEAILYAHFTLLE